ncbi:(d)CMP kinase [Oceanibaculum pacificum]|uniref:Cytidylate kinase n=1 Tax=Oceanibaculum pacificum TaxID=580166 RepID=A0A154W6E6_9PROT|nr:(d)CMP kinase [Oceanibaculum pacificum]KZD09069.1 cytidylate kinase [Oceanibaculum pacificum]
MIVAVDGPAASGKGTLARRIASALDFAYLDTGLLYRGVGVAVLDRGDSLDDAEAAIRAAQAFDPALMNDPRLRSEEASSAASKVAAIPGVRAAMLEFQRRFGHTPPGGKKGAVLDGRDIGTVIFPEADVKLFITASVEVRAERRHKELLGRGTPSIYARVLREMQERDQRDRSRSVAPMTIASDAVVIDTSAIDVEAAFQKAMAPVLEKISRQHRVR